MTDKTRTLAQWIAQTESRLKSAGVFFGHGTLTARDEAAWLVAAVAKIPPDQLNPLLDKFASNKEARRIVELTEKRIVTRIPLAYLLGEAWLCGHRFFVDQRTIIPRSYIAELLAESLSPWCRHPRYIRRILDLCTGSGCLAILAAFAFPRAKIDAADISGHALSVARKNIRAYALEERISLFKTDLFAKLPLNEYDLIISNPPYVKAYSMQNLPPEYRREPELALAGGIDGLDVIARIFSEADRHLKPKGHLLLEIGHNRPTFERRFPRLPVTWLTTSSRSDPLLWIDAEQLVKRV